MKTYKSVTSYCIAALALSLYGCGTSEPSENEISEAMVASDQNHALFGDPTKFKADLKKLGCEKSGEKSYKCLVGQRNGQGGSVIVNMMKTDSKWVMENFMISQ